jgi:hypothetical protein
VIVARQLELNGNPTLTLNANYHQTDVPVPGSVRSGPTSIRLGRVESGFPRTSQCGSESRTGNPRARQTLASAKSNAELGPQRDPATRKSPGS